MTHKISIDLETRSRVDLTQVGAFLYATDPSTEIICMSWAFGAGEPVSWCPLRGEEFPEQLAKYIEDGVPLHAFNSEFEELMFAYIICPDFDVPEPASEQWRCTAFQARCNNLPGALYNTARCLGVKHQKDRSGRNLIQMLSIPQTDGEFLEDPELIDDMIKYCEADVLAERACADVMREPTPEELHDFHVSRVINDRGVTIDVDLVVAMREYAAEEEAEITARVIEITQGEVRKFRGPQLLNWVKEHVEPHQLEALKVYRGGEKKYSMDKYSRHRILDLNDLDPIVREAIECADTAMKSSVGKANQMLNRADPEDQRMRGTFVPNGASQTGRFASMGSQTHNFPRDVMPDPEEVRLDLVENIMAEDMVDYFDRPIMHILSGMLRPCMVPAPGHKLLISDWSAIEGRTNPWLTNSPEGEAKLDLYREGIDTYKVAAQAIYGRAYEDIEPHQRQVGKVAELALGFGGGVGAFTAMARGYGVQVSAGEADVIKTKWRQANPWAQPFWNGCETAAKRAICDPGVRYNVGRVSYFAVEGILVGGTTLFCELPGGRLLTYPDARIEPGMTPWGAQTTVLTALRANWVPKDTEKEWPRATLWGGLLVENVTQATAASLLRHALSEAHSVGLDVVLHVHDELVVETPEAPLQIAAESEALHGIMNTAPDWAAGLPLEADVITADRFGK